MTILKFSQSIAENVNAFDAHPFEPIYRTIYVATGDDFLSNVSTYAHANIVTAVTIPGFGILFRQPLQIRRVGFKVYEIDAMYGRRNWGELEVTIRGSTTGGGTVRLKQSLDTILTSEDAPDFGGLIGVDTTADTIEGVEEELPALDYSLDITYPVGFLTNAMMATWADLKNKVNSVTFSGWGAGCVLYRGADFEGVPLGANLAPLSVSHQFSVSPKLSNVTISGFSGITKDGWDTLWWLTEDQEVMAGGATVTVKKPIHWYVERTKLRTIFQSVLGFG